MRLFCIEPDGLLLKVWFRAFNNKGRIYTSALLPTKGHRVRRDNMLKADRYIFEGSEIEILIFDGVKPDTDGLLRYVGPPIPSNIQLVIRGERINLPKKHWQQLRHILGMVKP